MKRIGAAIVGFLCLSVAAVHAADGDRDLSMEPFKASITAARENMKLTGYVVATNPHVGKPSMPVEFAGEATRDNAVMHGNGGPGCGNNGTMPVCSKQDSGSFRVKRGGYFNNEKTAFGPMRAVAPKRVPADGVIGFRLARSSR